jgi:DNA-binding MarR family transcriptional regulator
VTSTAVRKGLEQKGLVEVSANGVARLQRSREVTETDIGRRITGSLYGYQYQTNARILNTNTGTIQRTKILKRACVQPATIFRDLNGRHAILH